MEYKKIHKRLISSRWIFIFGLLMAVAMRFLAGTDPLQPIVWGVFALQILTASLLQYINRVNTLTQNRSMLPSFFYLLVMGASPSSYENLPGNILVVGIIISIIFLFQSYQEENSQLKAFNISAILTGCFFIWGPVILFLPLFWYGLYKFRALNLKSFLASLIGILTAFLFLFSWSMYKNDINIFLNEIPNEFSFDFQINYLSIPEWVALVSLIILLAIAKVNSLLARSSEKVRTSSFINFLYLMFVYTLILFFVFFNWKENLTPILFAISSMVMSQYFSSTAKKFTMYLLMFCILLPILIFFWKILT